MSLFFWCLLMKPSSSLSWIQSDIPALPYPSMAMSAGYDTNEESIWLLGGDAVNANTRNMLQYNTHDDNITVYPNLLYQIQSTSQSYTQIHNKMYIISDYGGDIGIFDMDTLLYHQAEITHTTDAMIGSCITNVNSKYLVILRASGIYILDINTTEWKDDGPSMIQTRYGFACNAVDNGLYAIGGRISGSGFLDTVEFIETTDILNMSAQSWTILSDVLSRARHLLRSVVYYDRIYVVGGWNGTGVAIVDIIDTNTKQISLDSYLITGVAYPTVIVSDACNKIFVFGGQTSGGLATAAIQYSLLPVYNISTYNPTFYPTRDPTHDPTFYPTNDPTCDPTHDPTLFPTNIPTVDPTVSPSLKCEEILIRDNINDNYYMNDNTIPLFNNWRFRATSTETFVYSDSYGTRATLFYLTESGWIIEILEYRNTLSNIVIYQSFIKNLNLPINNWYLWTPHTSEYSTISLFIECFETHSPTIYWGSNTTDHQISEEHITYHNNVQNILIQLLLIVIGLLILLLMIVLVLLYTLKAHIKRNKTVDRRKSRHRDIVEGIELQRSRNELGRNQGNVYEAIPMNHAEDAEENQQAQPADNGILYEAKQDGMIPLDTVDQPVPSALNDADEISMESATYVV